MLHRSPATLLLLAAAASFAACSSSVPRRQSDVPSPSSSSATTSSSAAAPSSSAPPFRSTRQPISRMTPVKSSAAPVSLAHPAAPATPDSPARSATSAAHLTPPPLTAAAPQNYPGLPNVVTYHENFYSGAVPEGALGFDSLVALGVKTIISVDGMAPDAELARTRGLRSIHLPIGYNGFDEDRRRELSRATRDALALGPVYIHCHHGKHRSAAAAGTVAVSLGWATPTEMCARMRVSGTAPGYKGLYACTAAATVLDASVLDAVPTNFVEAARPQGIVKSMIEIDDVFDNLKAIQTAGWDTPKDHPDLVPVAEAARLAELFRNLSAAHPAPGGALAAPATIAPPAKSPPLLAGPAVKAQAPEFARLMQAQHEHAQALEIILAESRPDAAKASATFNLVGASCKECHVAYRD